MKLQQEIIFLCVMRELCKGRVQKKKKSGFLHFWVGGWFRIGSELGPNPKKKKKHASKIHFKPL